MAVRDDRSDVKQTTAGFRGPLMVQSLTSAKSKFLSLSLKSELYRCAIHRWDWPCFDGPIPVAVKEKRWNSCRSLQVFQKYVNDN